MRNPALKQFQISLDQYKETVQNFLAPHRLELLQKQASWIQRTERWIEPFLISGADVDVHNIQPTLELVTKPQQHDIWRYCRLWGSIPYNKGCGRVMRYLLRDSGQPSSPIMGIVSFSSPVIINRPRDEWIGWEYPRDVELKRRRLLSCMDLSVSMAVPPYNHLTAGKMICLAALSNEVRRDYLNKYGDAPTPTGMVEGRLALITTTSLYGSSAQYNRLRVDNITKYKLVGYTSGFGNAHLTEDQFAEMEEYLRQIGKPIPKGWGTGRSYRLRVYTAYARNKLGERQAPMHEHPRSVYVAALAQNTQAFLQGTDDELINHDLPFEGLVDIWRNKWLNSRLSKPEVLERFRETNPTDMLVSSQLD